MTKRLLSEILWKAANEHLSEDGWYYPGRSMWSCNAVAKAVTRDNDAVSCSLPDDVTTFLRDCGCRTGKEDYTFGTHDDLKRQGVRYMWLLLAMHVAEDEGIEV